MTVSNSPSKVRDNRRRYRQKPRPARWNKGRWSHTYGAVDLGTNNCRLLVAKPESRSFRVIDSFSRIVRLGEGVSQSGQLSEAAINRTIEALSICADKMDRRGVSRMRCVATEVCRKAANSTEFLERVRAEVGIELDIISTEEEATLALNGCAPLLDYRNKFALVFDIGGGSTELVWLRLGRNRENRIVGWTSIPYGVVSLTEQHGDVSTDPTAYQRMIADVAVHVKAFEEKYRIREEIRRGRVQMLGTSGTVTTLAGVLFGLPRYNRRRVDGAWLQTSKILKICDRLASSDYNARAGEPCIGVERADLVVSGCAIVQAMYNTWPVRRLRVADRGVREGLLIGLMKDADREIEQAAELTPKVAEKLM
ncbi:Ppx/GppA phosphatase family protein [Sneathiella glossodoripedis]|uniref:Ppx/GppA phosphatase family protein n=1 Tax=Sneathiella glossodoripedis TaxID=418853 RepID=UPI001900BED8|nr:Ppx/GppA phosphatase family protein [Sneathiella glossodoripedis]